MVSSIIAADQWFESFLFSVRTPFFVDVFTGITFLGNELTIVVIAGIVGLFLLRSTTYRAYAVGLAATLFSAGVMAYSIKMLVGRARPGGLLPVLVEHSPSFPSGHATAAMALYGFLAYLLCALFPTKKPLILTAAATLVGSIGFSRLYLGVHFPSDVLAGYVFGGLALIIGIVVVKKLRNNKKI